MYIHVLKFRDSSGSAGQPRCLGSLRSCGKCPEPQTAKKRMAVSVRQGSAGCGVGPPWKLLLSGEARPISPGGMKHAGLQPPKPSVLGPGLTMPEGALFNRGVVA